jgi:hypothetical protein
MSDPIGLTVFGVEKGERYKFETVVTNLSAAGVCARAPRAIDTGQELLFQIRFSLSDSRSSRAPAVVIRGVVVRSEARRAGKSQFAAAFTCACVESFAGWW